MEKILSFGGGVQTTALAIMAARGDVKIDAMVFADTGCEKPETYWYMDNYTRPMLGRVGIPFQIVGNKQRGYDGGLYEHCWRKRILPTVFPPRWCSSHFKGKVIDKQVGNDVIQLVGFSYDEQYRSQKKIVQSRRTSYPLIDLSMTGLDCQRVISDYGWPIPTKSSCYICPFQRPHEWNWLKARHPELIQKAISLEVNLYERRPLQRDYFGLLGGKPLWKFMEGIQAEFDLVENSCWSGQCGH